MPKVKASAMDWLRESGELPSGVTNGTATEPASILLFRYHRAADAGRAERGCSGNVPIIVPKHFRSTVLVTQDRHE
jgi:hypothetical protein